MNLCTSELPGCRFLLDPVTAIIAASVIGAGTSIATGMMNKPKLPPVPKLNKNPEQATRVKDATERQRRQALAAYGRSQTIRTSPLGIVNAGTSSTGKTSLGA